MEMYGGIEGGGTKFNCAIGSSPDNIQAEICIPTTSPEETIGRSIDFFKKQSVVIKSLGIGSFGPLDLKPNSPSYGKIMATTKLGWEDTDIVGIFKSALNVPVGFDTDVNVAALGEYQWGEAKGLDTFVYLTIGTGIGGGVIVNGKFLHGMLHSELGHAYIPHDREADPFKGVCPFHVDCFEGLASGPAMEARWGQKAETLPGDHPAWKLEAHYLALGLVNIITTLSPQKIIIGGGVMHMASLYPLVRKEVQKLLNGYIGTSEIMNQIDSYILPPALGDRVGILGAIALAQQVAI